MGSRLSCAAASWATSRHVSAGTSTPEGMITAVSHAAARLLARTSRRARGVSTPIPLRGLSPRRPEEWTSAPLRVQPRPSDCSFDALAVPLGHHLVQHPPRGLLPMGLLASVHHHSGRIWLAVVTELLAVEACVSALGGLPPNLLSVWSSAGCGACTQLHHRGKLWPCSDSTLPLKRYPPKKSSGVCWEVSRDGDGKKRGVTVAP
jgi:hypothetical protein